MMTAPGTPSMLGITSVRGRPSAQTAAMTARGSRYSGSGNASAAGMPMTGRPTSRCHSSSTYSTTNAGPRKSARTISVLSAVLISVAGRLRRARSEANVSAMMAARRDSYSGTTAGDGLD